jgi:hypothetical protein
MRFYTECEMVFCEPSLNFFFFFFWLALKGVFSQRYKTCSNRCANVLKIKNFPVFSSLPGRNSYFSLARWSGFLTIKPKRRFSYEFLTSYEFLPSKNLLKRTKSRKILENFSAIQHIFVKWWTTQQACLVSVI